MRRQRIAQIAHIHRGFVTMYLLYTAYTIVAVITCTDAKEYCHNDEFTAECNDGMVILMTSALYGRMTIGPCVKTDFGFVGCYADVIAHAHARCSGRKSCSIRVPDATLDMTRPCNEDLKSYLEVSHTCVKVASPVPVANLSPGASPCNLTVTTSDAVGYLSNRHPVSSPGTRRCGTESDPWILNVLPGQRINVTLLDFTAPTAETSASVKPVDRRGRPSTLPTMQSTTTSGTPPAAMTTAVAMATGCDRYAVVTDTTTTTVTPHRAETSGPGIARSPTGEANSELCGLGGIKQSLQSSSQQSPHLELASSQTHGFSSFGSAVKIVLDHIVTSTIISNTSDSIGYNYLLKFEAVGCPDPKTPSNGWLKRDMNQMTAGCLRSDVTWTMACVGTKWQGTSFNCSIASIDGQQGGLMPNLSMGESLLIILIVSLAIGVIILLLGVLYFKRRRLSSNALTHSNRQLRDLKPLNALSDESAYDSTPTGVYARNAAFDPPSRITTCRRKATFDPPSRVTTCRRQGNVDRAANVQASSMDVDDDNEYEYVWDAAAGSAEVHCGGGIDAVGRGKDHVSATFKRDPMAIESGQRMNTRPRDPRGAASSGRHQCSCMTGGGGVVGDQMRTMPSSRGVVQQASASNGGRDRGKLSSTNAATVGRFNNLESRSSSSSSRAASSCGGGSKAAGLPTARTVEESVSRGGGGGCGLPRVCPHCDHPLSASSRLDGGSRTMAAACTTGTPLIDGRRHRPEINSETTSHRQQPVQQHRFM